MQKTDVIKVKIKNLLDSGGISMMGTSSADPRPGVPKDFSPQALLKDAKSVICYAMPIPEGVVFAESNAMDLYWRFCNMAYRSLDVTSNQLCLTLEEKGALAVPIYGCFPWKLVHDQFWGLLPLVHWAEQAGLGRLAKCGLLANSECGTRLLLGGVVTTLDLEPTGSQHGEPCPPDCFDCIEACPVHAIDRTGKVDHKLCIRYSISNPLAAHLVRDLKTRDTLTFERLLNTVGVDDHASYQCFKCLEVCPLNHT
jgi:epoxyqueuosine reductase QueG